MEAERPNGKANIKGETRKRSWWG